MVFKNWYAFALVILLGAISCEKESVNPDPTNDDPKATLRIEMTDAPTDNPEVEGVFVTVAEVKLDGEVIEGFEKTTFDISAYQQGDVKLFVDEEVKADSYSKIELVFDIDEDADGNSPGTYVKEKDGGKYKLSEESDLSVVVNSEVALDSGETKTVLVDFDLRKTVQAKEGEEKYSFAAGADLTAGFRVVKKEDSGVIKGEVSNNITSSEVIVAYVYEKGDYNKDTETNGQGSANIEFKNSISSSAVDENGKFEVHFLDEGTYELHFGSYDVNSEGELELTGTLLLDAFDLTNLEVNANSTTNISLNVIGILDL